MSYEDLVAEIKSCPESYLPALLIAVVEECYARKALQSGGAKTLAGRVEKRLGMEAKKYVRRRIF